MIISGFTFVRNAIKYDYPIIESIKSVLPLVDEMIICLGKSEDGTETLIDSIKSDKIKIINTDWDTSKFNKGGMIYANQTDIALKACKGDWCVYIQGDEVLHEDAIPQIRSACSKYLNNKNIDGFLLRYVHLYGDYEHYISAKHFGYPREIRVVRNNPDIHSWRDAQSFRYIPNFDGENYERKKDTNKLNCILLTKAFMFHYGWCRDPRVMSKKIVNQCHLYDDKSKEIATDYYDYGNISSFPIFRGSHPAIMKERMKIISYKDYLRYSGSNANQRKIFGLKYRILSFFEQFMKDGNTIGGYKNYNLIEKFP
jgi:hypothetical protein